jgi:CheY-like chemotaxis protein
LIIDDDPAMRELLERYLSRSGFRVVSAADGKSGLNMAKVLKPSVIVLDIMMPRIDGWEVLNMIKRDPELSCIPVVMVSMADDRKKGYALGASSFLTKPISWETLDGVIKNAVRGGNRSDAPVLVVDDNAEIRDLLRRTLEGSGWVVAEATNGREALAEVASQVPSLILLDLVMPEMDGFSFMAELRANPEWREIPIIVLTARDLSGDDKFRLAGSVQNILQKGAYSTEQLLREVRSMVSDYSSIQNRVVAETAEREQR